MIVGFTGTREGMTEAQRAAFSAWLTQHPQITEFHHGCCRGADAMAVLHVVGDPSNAAAVVSHPCDLAAEQSEQAARFSDRTTPVASPLVRNREIVEACEVLLACPRGPEERRSGTWATLRYARRTRKKVVIFWPDGTVS